MNITAQSGIALRNIDISSGEFDSENPDTSSFDSTVEIQDVKNGKYCNNINIYASYKDNNGNGNEKTETLIKTIPSSDFYLGDRGLLKADITVKISELKEAFEFENTDFKTCDIATIKLEAVGTDGKVYTNTNVNPTVSGGSYFSSPFVYSANITGGVLTESLAGTHTFTTKGMFIPGSDSCGGTVTGSITWDETGTPGLYSTTDMSFGLFESDCWSDDPAYSSSSQIKWFCKTLTGVGVDQYQSSWSYEVESVVGSIMKVKFLSSYDEGGTATITREGGADWPAIMQD
jgi:hypothetical protein